MLIALTVGTILAALLLGTLVGAATGGLIRRRSPDGHRAQPARTDRRPDRRQALVAIGLEPIDARWVWPQPWEGPASARSATRS